MAERRKRVDAVIIGYGWTGAIMAKTLTDAGLSVVALERGPARDTSPDFEYPRIADELKYGMRGDLWQPLAKETVTIRHGVNDRAAPYRKYGSFIPGNGVGGAGVHWNGQLWRASPGRLPGPIPGTTRWDRHAIDAALDEAMSKVANENADTYNSWKARYHENKSKGNPYGKRKLANGEVRVHRYCWRGGPKLEGIPGSPEFTTSYLAAVATRKSSPSGTLFGLISEFKKTTDFLGLAPSTRKAYESYLKIIEDEFGSMPLGALKDSRVRGDFKAWRDRTASTPRAADYAWTVLARVLSVAKDRGRITVNPCERGGRLYSGGRADKVWTEDDLSKLFAHASKPMYRAVMIALWTGQRQGDLLRLTWTAYDGKTIKLTQSKTKRNIVIPVSPTLRDVLKASLKVSPTILTGIRKKSWTSQGFQTMWQRLLAKASIKDLTFHDLRGSAVLRLALSGCTVPEIVSITGHSLGGAEAILDKHYLGRDVKLAEGAIRKLTRKEKRTKTVNGL